MSKPRKKLEVRRRSTVKPPPPASGGLGVQYYQAPSPLQGIPQEDVARLIAEVGQESERSFQQAFTQLQWGLKGVDPLLFLSALAAYELTHKAGTDPEVDEEHPVLQAHVELVHALVLRNPLEEFTRQTVITPELYESLRELAVKVQRTFSYRRLVQMQVSGSAEERSRFGILESMRVNTQMVRNWAYVDQMVRVVREIFRPLDRQIQQLYGITVHGLMGLFDGIIHTLETRFHEHFDRQRPVYRAKSVEQAVTLYFDAFPVSAEDRDRLLGLFRQHKATRSQVKDMLLGHSNLFLPDIYTFSLEELHQLYPEPVQPDHLLRLMRLLSLGFGDLAGTNAEHLFLSNPVWSRPFVNLGDNDFFLPIPGLLRSNCLEIAEGLLAGQADLLARYAGRRGEYLEETTEQLFRSAMPAAQVFRGSQWIDPATGKRLENDLLVVLDCFAIVVEAKAGKVTEPARRGAMARLERTIQDLMISPSIQAERFASFLRENPGEHLFDTKHSEANRVNTTQVKRVIRLSVTLDFMGAIASKWPALREAGLVPEDLALAPTIPLTDLEVLFHIFENQCEILHYLIRRSQFELHADYLGDELDLLAFYLDTGMNIGVAEFTKEPLLLHGMSKYLDPYFLDDLQQTPKPRLKLTQFWRDVITTVEQRKATGWTEMGCLLLNVEHLGQKHLEKAIRRICQRTRRDWGNPSNENVAVLATGPHQRRDVILATAYRGLTREERHAYLVAQAGKIAREQGVTRVLVMGYDVDHQAYPYNALGFFQFREDDSSSEGYSAPEALSSDVSHEHD